MDPVEQLAELMARDDDQIELDRVAALIAQREYPDLDIGRVLRQLDDLASDLQPRLRSRSESRDVVGAMAAMLHDDLGFRGNATDYYDPRNSYLNEVLDRRLGIPISLSAVYLEVGRRLKLPFEGVGMPGHFLLRYRDPLQPLLVDAFHGGQIIPEDECEAWLRSRYGPMVDLDPRMLEPVSTRSILFRMLANLKGIYMNQSDWPRTLRVIELALIVRPGASGEYRSRALAYLHTGNMTRARADLEHVLLNAVEPDEIRAAREQLALLDRLDERRN